MLISQSSEFIDQIKVFRVDTEYAVIKPNWVSSNPGEYTEPEILDWLLDALPNQKKIIVESYTPWRGLKFAEDDDHTGQGVTLAGGKKYWDYYKKQDEHFLKTTGIAVVLQKHKAEYVNITNEVWNGNCVEPEIIKNIVTNKGKSVKWQELYSYIPQKLFAIRESVTLISLSKIKVEESIPVIYISMSIKNLFGLIPHPSRWIPFHGEDHTPVPEVIKDIYSIYTSVFENSLWITEGIKTLVRNYCEPNQKIIAHQNLLFIGKDAQKVDSEACEAVGLDPKRVVYLK
jgi:uncharacterized protein (DUF362 family)